jgi:hypothetical protein
VRSRFPLFLGERQRKQKADHLRKIATPYCLAETVGVVGRNLFGPDHRNRGRPMRFLPRRYSLNPISAVDVRIAFLGDIMSVGRCTLVIDASVAAYISDSDYLVANLEATMTRRRRRRGVWIGALQWQNEHVAATLAALFLPKATYLSVANNHAGDFERQDYAQSCSLLEHYGFHLFGQADRPYADLNEHVRLHAGTMWSNQVCERIHWLCADRDPAPHRPVNILFPHWGFELEHYPRPEIVNMAKAYCTRFDAILGHHPHTVQPITMQRVGTTSRLIAYSLGDFCSNIRRAAYRYGMVVKLEIGPASTGQYRVGNLQWRFVESRRRTGNNIAIRIVDQIPYLVS